MTPLNKKQNILKQFLDSKWAWDMVQGPIYNHLVYNAASELFQLFVSEIQPPKNAKILDVGSGPGFMTFQLARENPTISIIGVDYSANQVRAANHLCTHSQIQNCSFRVGDAMNLPFDDASFDIVISFGSIKHWQDGKRGLQEIRRVLTPSGSAFIGEADRSSTDEEIYRFANKFCVWYVWEQLMTWYIHRIVFKQSYTQKEVESIAREAEFNQVSVNKVLGWPYFMMKLQK